MSIKTLRTRYDQDFECLLEEALSSGYNIINSGYAPSHTTNVGHWWALLVMDDEVDEE